MQALCDATLQPTLCRLEKEFFSTYISTSILPIILYRTQRCLLLRTDPRQRSAPSCPHSDMQTIVYFPRAWAQDTAVAGMSPLCCDPGGVDPAQIHSR